MRLARWARSVLRLHGGDDGSAAEPGPELLPGGAPGARRGPVRGGGVSSSEMT